MKEKVVKPKVALLVDHVNCAVQAREFSKVEQDVWGQEKVMEEVFDIRDLIGYVDAHWEIRSVDVFLSSHFWERMLARDRRLIQNAVGNHNIHRSTRERKSPTAFDPVDKKLIEFARRRIRGVGKEAVDGIVIASSDGDFAKLLPYATSKGKEVHFVAYMEPSHKLIHGASVTILRDLITRKYR